MQSELPQIPKEIVLGKILPKLPVKSLQRFRCVSKHWCAAISDPKFSLSHGLPRVAILMEARNSNVITRRPSSFGYNLSIRDLKSSSSEVLSTYKWKKTGCQVMFMSSYNGLLLFLRRGDPDIYKNPSVHMILLNPSTGQYNEFDIHTHLDCHRVFTGGMFHNFSTNTYNFAFGIYQLGKDFKTHGWKLRIVDWKTKLQRDFPFPYYTESYCLVLDDKLHWLVYKKDGKRIISFDPVKNRFIELPLPVPKDDEIIMSLLVLDGQLAVARWHNFCWPPKDGVIELLLMKQYGVKESWTILFTFRNFNGNPPYRNRCCGNFTLLSCTKEGDVVIRIYSKTFAYNIKEDRYRSIFAAECFDKYTVVSFVESPFWPPDIASRSCYKRSKRGIVGAVSSYFGSLFSSPNLPKLSDRLP